MTIARRHIVLAGQDCMYHCISRCVRRAFLFGSDRISRKNFDHRKAWLHDRIHFLTTVFSIEVLAYALMDNHVHILIRTRWGAVESLDDEEVARRWLTLYPRHTLEALRVLVGDKRRIELLRSRLANVSWFMKSLNEYVARRANQEDDCKGRFWEGRFKCQRVEDEAAALACAIYIDLNPIRAAAAATPEQSEFTSAWERIGVLRDQSEGAAPAHEWLAPTESFLSLDVAEYLAVLDWTGREFRSDKRGAVPRELAPILQRLGLDSEHWLLSARHYGNWFYLIAGNANALTRAAVTAGKKWFKGLANARKLFSGAPLPA